MEIAESKGISKDKVIEIIEAALASAYKKEYGKKKEKYEAKLDPKNGEVEFWQVKQVVDEKDIIPEEEAEKLKEEGKEIPEGKVRFSPERHITLKEAKKINKKIKAGDFLKTPVESKDVFGRIAAQTAKQVILQKLKEAEREAILNEYKAREGGIVSGIVQRVEPTVVFFDIGRTSGILPKSEQVPGEFYRPGQRLKLYITKVEVSPRGAVVFLSRSYPKLVSKLFELEVPEISAGQIEIKSIAREPGSRTKVAVKANEENVDPIGSMVGQRGTRIAAVINELGGEKIDVVEWDEDPEKYIANALNPAKVLSVKILPKNTAEVLVSRDQFSLAIGKNGQNVRLAAKLTGWKIDVKSSDGMESHSSEEAGEESEEMESGEKKELKKNKSPETDEKENGENKEKKVGKEPEKKETSQ